MPQGRHRPKPQTYDLPLVETWEYTLPLVDTWESARTRYAKPSRWAWLTKWVRRG